MATAVYDTDFRTAEKLVDPVFQSLAYQVAMAVASERERCAKIAENQELSFVSGGTPSRDLRLIQAMIATAIRKQ